MRFFVTGIIGFVFFVVGMGTSRWMNDRSNTVAPVNVLNQRSVTIPTTTPSPHDDARLAELERQIALLRAERRQSGSTPPSENNAPAPRPEPSRATAPTTPQEATEQVHVQQADALNEHRRENVDPQWSAPATTAFTGYVYDLAPTAGYIVTSTPECRMTSCLTSIRWPHCREAIEGVNRMSHAQVRDGTPISGCTQTVLQEAPAPEHAGDACNGIIQFNCEAVRAPTANSPSTR